ncbi:MAG: hypothetical protein IJF67_12275 [Clostridia bacterium]|nr:hypothetical protein [Clostridia bacterium]
MKKILQPSGWRIQAVEKGEIRARRSCAASSGISPQSGLMPPSPKGKALAIFCQVLSEQTAVFAFPSGEGGSTRSGETDEAYTMGYR